MNWSTLRIGPHIHLRAGHERAHADIDRQAAFHAAQHAAGNGQLILERLFEVVPDLEPRGFFVGEHERSLRKYGRSRP